jgi:outer membrane protein assembly factor BamB
MTVIPFPTRAASRLASSNAPRIATNPKTAQRALRALLDPSKSAKEDERLELPPFAELLHALIELAEGTRQKALVPVVGMPIELALLRRGASALVSIYHTEASPSALSIDRRVPLRALLDAAAAALREERTEERSEAANGPDDAEARLLTRAEHTAIVDLPDDGQSARKIRGGAVDDPGQERPLAFGFDASIFPGQLGGGATVCHADVHAMLFSGQLWAWVRGRRIPLYRGPILLAAQRMLAAAGGFIDAWREGRAGHVRLRTGGFTVALRGDRSESPGVRASRLSLTLGSDEDGVVTIPQLEIPAATRAILRLCSELLRALCAADRSQSRNLRVRTLRGEVRRISRSVREVSRQGSFTSGDPDRLRMRQRTAAGDVSAPELDMPSAVPTTPRLGWTSRWTASLPSLDAEHTHLIGEILITHTEQGLVAVDRDSGDALWQAEGRVSLVLVSPQGVLSVGETGTVCLRDARTGDALFETRLSKRASGSPSGLCVSGPSIPPTAILSEGREAISAIDLRTGELRWRLASAGSQRLERAGRVLIVVGNDGALTAVDVVTGQLAWRFADDVHVALAPALSGEVVTVISGEPGRGAHELLGLDLFSGRLLYRVELASPVEVAPIAAHDRVLVAMKSGRNVVLAAHDARTGRECWSRSDPGVGSGAGVLQVDGKVFVNAPNGRLTAVDLTTGSTRWQRVLSAAESDDVPRQLTPILRGGALFVPSGTIHVLRPDDGASLGGRTQGGLPSDLLPDLLRIDERGWMYVGEESGHLVALAPSARLSLVPGSRLALVPRA